MHTRTPRGFTLIELLLVLVLVGVLAGTAMATFGGFRARSFDSKVASAVRHVATSEEAYFANHRRYTNDLADLEGVALADVTIVIMPGNSGDLGTSFRVVGTHAAAVHRYTWVSDPTRGQANLIED